MRFLRESALDKVRLGMTTLKEINKVTFIESMRMSYGAPEARSLRNLNARRSSASCLARFPVIHAPITGLWCTSRACPRIAVLRSH